MSLAVSACGAGWDAEVWPSEDHFRGYSKTNTLNVFVKEFITTNLYGVVATNDWIVHAQVNSNSWSGSYDTNFSTQAVLQVKDLWSWDAVASLSERANVSATGPVLPYQGAFWRYEHTNLVQYKAWLTANIPAFLNPKEDYEPWTVTGLLDHVYAPTNWDQWTPWRQLNGAGEGYEREITNTFYIAVVTNGGPPYTNTVWDSWGNEHTISGAAGSTNVIIATNENILAGFTSLDYGWKYFDEIVNELHLVPETVAFGWTSGSYTSKNDYSWLAANKTNWLAAKTSCEAASPLTSATANRLFSYTWGRKNATNRWDAFAEARKNVITISTIATNYDHKACAVVYPQLPPESVTTNTYDSMGTGWAYDSANIVYTSAVFSGAATTSAVLGSITFPTPWVDEPATTAARGYLIDSSDIKGYSDFAVTNGFRYQ